MPIASNSATTGWCGGALLPVLRNDSMTLSL